jgi:YD repeat-containing protein
VKATDNAGSNLFSYDGAGRLTQRINPVGSVNYTIDALGRVTSRQVAGQPAVTHTYDATGNLLTAAMGGTTEKRGRPELGDLFFADKVRRPPAMRYISSRALGAS